MAWYSAQALQVRGTYVVDKWLGDYQVRHIKIFYTQPTKTLGYMWFNYPSMYALDLRRLILLSITDARIPTLNIHAE